MALKKYKPATPGTRWKVGNAFEEITTDKPEKSLLAPRRRKGGRNVQGRMVVRNVGGGHKRRYRIIDFKRNKKDIPAKVKTIEYDPNRSAFIALVVYADGEKRYIIAPKGIQVGMEIISGDHVAPEVGNALPLKNMPLGTVVHNIEMRPGSGGAIARSAGAHAQLTAKEGKYAVLKMPSGEQRRILVECMATVGHVSNSDHQLESYGKAGTRRWKGRRPRVRGVAMNPVDHPMGGGEGKASGGLPRSRNGQYAKGQKTRDPNKASNRLIIQRRKKKKKK